VMSGARASDMPDAAGSVTCLVLSQARHSPAFEQCRWSRDTGKVRPHNRILSAGLNPKRQVSHKCCPTGLRGVGRSRASELGRAVKTIFLFHYLRQETFRREAHEGLNVVETGTAPTGSYSSARATKSPPTGLTSKKSPPSRWNRNGWAGLHRTIVEVSRRSSTATSTPTAGSISIWTAGSISAA
jgi:Tn3 transposase DDE domain